MSSPKPSKQGHPTTRELIPRLFAHRPWWKELWGRDDERVAAIEELGRTGEVWVIPYLAPFLFERPPEARAAAGEACSRLLAVAGASDYLWLEHNFRSRCDGPRALEAMDPGEVEHLATATGRPTVARGLLSLHWNGHVREAAVRLLGAAGGAEAVPLLRLRLNDWVPPVQAAAQEALIACLARVGLEPQVAHLPLLARLGRGTRIRAESFVEELRGRLVQQPAAIHAGLRSADPACGGNASGWRHSLPVRRATG